MRKFKKYLVGLLACMTLLSGCATADEPETTEYTYANTIEWAAEYDVVVAGFGAAGAASAKTAADEGADVLIVEKMSEGESGGNSKVAGQLFVNGHGDIEKTIAYFKALAGDKTIDEDVLRVFCEGVADIENILNDDFGADKSQFMDYSSISTMSPEYPELEGSDGITLNTIHAGYSDSALYQLLKKNVVDRSDKIDVWFESPAVHLIQDPETKTIIGVQVVRNGETLNVRALNGVVLATGGFEDNAEMVETYLGITEYVPQGALYNTGDGIRMAMEVGADLWHMDVYEGGFSFGSTTYYVGEGERSIRLPKTFDVGSIILVGTAGERFVNESEEPRHGHVFNNGVWENVETPDRIWTVFDQKEYDELITGGVVPERFHEDIVKATTIAELAEATGMDPEILTQTISLFNKYAETGLDEQFGRPADRMSAFDGEAYYALPMKTTILNTQGGPKRNENAEVLDVNGNPIPHLYSAGELGGLTSEMYQGGANLAECIIFGQIAGRNAAKEKEALPTYIARIAVESAPTKLGEVTDLGGQIEIETAENEYVGTADGIGGALYVKVKMDGDKIAKVEVVSHSESEGICEPAIEQIPAAIVDNNGTDGVDTVSGATVTSKAIIEAVEDALAQIK